MKKNKPLCIGLMALTGWLGFHPSACAEETETVVPVRTGVIVRTTLHGYGTAYGRVQPVPEARVTMRPLSDGVIARVVCRPGQLVDKGDLLFQLDAREAELVLTERQQALAFAQQEYERQVQLLKIEGTSQKEVQQTARDFHMAEQALAAAQLQLDYLSVRAPMAGTVVSVNTAPGEAVQASQPLAILLDPSRRVLSIQVPAVAMDAVREKQPVQVSIGEAWLDAGSVGSIAAEVNRANGTVEVRSMLPPESPLRIGQFVQARILFETHADCLAVPVDALVTDPEGGTYIAAIHGDRARRLPVVGNLREGGWVEVEGDGLAEGMDIATEGAYGLPEETRVEVIGK